MFSSSDNGTPALYAQDRNVLQEFLSQPLEAAANYTPRTSLEPKAEAVVELKVESNSIKTDEKAPAVQPLFPSATREITVKPRGARKQASLAYYIRSLGLASILVLSSLVVLNIGCLIMQSESCTHLTCLERPRNSLKGNRADQLNIISQHCGSSSGLRPTRRTPRRNQESGSASIGFFAHLTWCSWAWNTSSYHDHDQWNLALQPGVEL